MVGYVLDVWAVVQFLESCKTVVELLESNQVWLMT